MRWHVLSQPFIHLPVPAVSLPPGRRAPGEGNTQWAMAGDLWSGLRGRSGSGTCVAWPGQSRVASLTTCYLSGDHELTG